MTGFGAVDVEATRSNGADSSSVSVSESAKRSSAKITFRLQIGQTRRPFVNQGSMQTAWNPTQLSIQSTD